MGGYHWDKRICPLQTGSAEIERIGQSYTIRGTTLVWSPTRGVGGKFVRV